MNKFNACKTEANGMKFASAKEAKRYAELLLMERAGLIKELKTQVVYELIPKNEHFRSCSYIADFTYYENGIYIVEDVKGYKGGASYAIYSIKKKLMFDRYKIVINES